MSDSLPPHGLYSPQNSPGQNTGLGSLFLLQGIFPIQESNRGLLHFRFFFFFFFFTSWATREAHLIIQTKSYKISHTCKLTCACVSEKEGTERKLIFRETNKIFYTDPSCLPKSVKSSFYRRNYQNYLKLLEKEVGQVLHIFPQTVSAYQNKCVRGILMSIKTIYYHKPFRSIKLDFSLVASSS